MYHICYTGFTEKICLRVFYVFNMFFCISNEHCCEQKAAKKTNISNGIQKYLINTIKWLFNL